jgi:hypothetical protein
MLRRQRSVDPSLTKAPNDAGATRLASPRALRFSVGISIARERTGACRLFATEEDDAMPTDEDSDEFGTEVDILDYAQRLFDAHGIGAIAEAAQKARQFEERGDSEQARIWRRIEEALKQMRGPHVS